MKKFLSLLVILSFSISICFGNHRPKSNYEVSTSLVPFVAGAAFIAAGLLQRPDKVWVPDNTSSIVNGFGSRGRWREETILESPGRSAAIGTGLLLIGIGVVIRF